MNRTCLRTTEKLKHHKMTQLFRITCSLLTFPEQILFFRKQADNALDESNSYVINHSKQADKLFSYIWKFANDVTYATKLIVNIYPWNFELFKVTNKNNREASGIGSELTLKTLEWLHWEWTKINATKTCQISWNLTITERFQRFMGNCWLLERGVFRA